MSYLVQHPILAPEPLVLRLGRVSALCLLLRVLSVHPQHHMLIIFLLLMVLGVTMKTMRLIPALLPPLRLRIKLLLLGIWLEVHSKIIKLLLPSEVLRLLLLLLKKFIWPILSLMKSLFFFNLILLMLNSTTKMFLMFFMYPYVIIIKINQRSFFIISKKVILPIIINPLKWFHRIIIKMRWT